MSHFYLHVLYYPYVQDTKVKTSECLCINLLPSSDNFYVQSPHANAALDTEGPVLALLCRSTLRIRLAIDLQNRGCPISGQYKISNFICSAIRR